jgi:hypothetical protein
MIKKKKSSMNQEIKIFLFPFILFQITDAYDTTLALLHTWVVRAGIKTGMLGLPSREHFFSSIGETDETAKAHAEGFTKAADAIVATVDKLYDGVEMPRSDFNVKNLWS